MFANYITISTIILLINPSTIFGQTTLSGKVIDKNTSKGIPYATVGLVKQNTGTTTDQYGTFLIKPISKNDSIIVSSVGYYTLTMPLSRLNEDSVIPLQLKESNLPELVILSKSSSIIEVNHFSNCSSNYYSGDQIVVTQLAQYFDAPKINMKLKEVSLCKVKGKSLFRIHIYDIDSISGKPSVELTPTSILVNSSDRSVKIDLDKYDIVVPKKSFFIAIEWLYLPSNEAKVKTKFNDKKVNIKSYYPWISYRQTNSKEEEKTIKRLWFLNFNGTWSEMFPMYKKLNFLISAKLL